MKAKKLLILNRIHDIDQIKSIIKENEIEIYSLNFSVHSVLNENKIPHVMSEELLAEDDLNKIFDKTVELYDWHKVIGVHCRFLNLLGDNLESGEELSNGNKNILIGKIIKSLYDLLSDSP